MILVLCNENDESALWAAEALRRRGHAVRVVTDRGLADAESWNHRVGRAGADCEIRFAVRDVLRASDTRGVLNRLSFVPAAWLHRHGGPDRDYAVQEMHAFYLSWLHALPGPVLNPPTPQGLAGNWRHASAWTALAVAAGLPVERFRQTSADDPAAAWQRPPPTASVYVAGDRVVGRQGEGLCEGLIDANRAACLRLARAAGVPLLGIDFTRDRTGRWRMTGASVMPALIAGGEPLIDALEEALAP